jgi:hypothetical protein
MESGMKMVVREASEKQQAGAERLDSELKAVVVQEAAALSDL